jgi:hypothetical protein
MWLPAGAANAAARPDFISDPRTPPISRQNLCSADLFFLGVVRETKCAGWSLRVPGTGVVHGMLSSGRVHPPP